ncbi:MAG: histidine kinase [Ferruginibacter sp.]
MKWAKGILQAVLITICIANNNAYPQPFPQCKFYQLADADGFPANLTTVLLKDKRGIMWIGTEMNGLLRYDGKQTRSYYDSAGINNSHIAFIEEDMDGTLWVGTLEGLYHFDPQTEATEHYRHDETDLYSVATNEKPQPYLDSKGRIWVGSKNGLQLFDRSAKNFIRYHIPPVKNPEWQLHKDNISFIYDDNKGNIWAGSPYGLYLIDTANRTVKLYPTGKYQFLTSMITDHRNKYWISSWNGGLKEFSPRTGAYTDIPGTPEIIRALKLWKDAAGNYWLVFPETEGISLFDTETKKIKQYNSANRTVAGFKGSQTKHIYIDRQGRIWSTNNYGINILDNALQGFNTIQLCSDCKDLFLKEKDPKAMLVNDNSYYISSWFGDGLYEFDKNWNLKTHVKAIPPQSKTLGSRSIYTMQKDTEGNTWYGTDSGLVLQKGNTFKVLLPKDEYANLDERYAARNITERKNGQCWARFPSRGIYRFNKSAAAFGKNYRSQFKGNAIALIEDKKQDFWLFAEENIYRFSDAADSFINVSFQHTNKQSLLENNYLFQVFFDDNNIGWIASMKGLLRFDPSAVTIDLITDPFHKKDKIILRLLQDKNGIIWMQSISDLIAYNNNTQQFRHFNAVNGLPPNFSATPNIFSWIDSNTIAVSSTGMITLFNPYQVITKAPAIPLIVTDVEADGKRIIPGSDEMILSIRLHSAAKKLLIHFSYPNYTYARFNQLYYRIKNNSAEWIETKDGDILLYDLPHGSYQLEIKAANSVGFSEEIIALIDLTIEPYWYQTILFKAICLLGLLGIVYIIIKARIRAARKQISFRQRIAETEMAALKAQMNPHFMFNCINSIDAFIQTNDKYNATLYLNKFARLIRNVLDSSKENLVLFSKDIETLRLYIELEELRSDHKFVTRLDVDEELMSSDYKIPPLIVQPFVENAILHGLRNKPGKEGVLKISIQKKENDIEYNIRDNGIGIAQSSRLNEGKRSSYGMQMSFDRIKLFNKEETPSVKIEDLYENGQPAGTLVTVKLIII